MDFLDSIMLYYPPEPEGVSLKDVYEQFNEFKKTKSYYDFKLLIEKILYYHKIKKVDLPKIKDCYNLIDDIEENMFDVYFVLSLKRKDLTLYYIAKMIKWYEMFGDYYGIKNEYV